MTVQYRQGDVLIVAVEGVCRGTVVPRDDRGRIVLAEGEATGHAHAVLDERAELFRLGLDRFLTVSAPEGVDLTHEQHAPIRLPEGTYRVVRQGEFTGNGRGWSWLSD